MYKYNMHIATDNLVKYTRGSATNLLSLSLFSVHCQFKIQFSNKQCHVMLTEENHSPRNTRHPNENSYSPTFQQPK
jgi:hypothetical protein